MLVEAHKEIGNKWAEIAKRIPGRTENSIKNHWNATKRKQSSKRKRLRKAIDGDTDKLTFLQEYIKSKTLSLNEITPTTSPSASRSSPANEYQMKLLQAPQPNDSDLASQMVEELLSVENPAEMWAFEEEEQYLLGCSDVEYVSQFLNTEEESFLSLSSNVTSAGSEAQSRSGGSHLQWDFYLSNQLNRPSLPAIDEFGSSNADMVTCFDGHASPIRSGGDMDLMEIFNWHLSDFPRYI